MPTIDDVRLPVDVERGAKGGPGFTTQIVSMANGAEQRNQEWELARGSYNIGYGIQSVETLKTVLRFFYARRGMARAFRFKDWLDFATDRPEPVGTTGDPLTRQLQKTYDDSILAYVRPITLPIADTLSVFVDNIATTSFTLGSNGVLTFPSDPGVNVKATFEFDVPCRFDTDNLQTTLTTFMAGEIPSIPIVEIR